MIGFTSTLTDRLEYFYFTLKTRTHLHLLNFKTSLSGVKEAGNVVEQAGKTLLFIAKQWTNRRFYPFWHNVGLDNRKLCIALGLDIKDNYWT